MGTLGVGIFIVNKRALGPTGMRPPHVPAQNLQGGKGLSGQCSVQMVLETLEVVLQIKFQWNMVNNAL